MYELSRADGPSLRFWMPAETPCGGRAAPFIIRILTPMIRSSRWQRGYRQDLTGYCSCLILAANALLRSQILVLSFLGLTADIARLICIGRFWRVWRLPRRETST